MDDRELFPFRKAVFIASLIYLAYAGLMVFRWYPAVAAILNAYPMGTLVLTWTLVVLAWPIALFNIFFDLLVPYFRLPEPWFFFTYALAAYAANLFGWWVFLCIARVVRQAYRSGKEDLLKKE